MRRGGLGVDIEIGPGGAMEPAERLLLAVAQVRETARFASEGGGWRLRVTFATEMTSEARASATEACVAALVGAGYGVREVRAGGASLEDVFALLTGADGAGDGTSAAPPGRGQHKDGTSPAPPGRGQHKGEADG
jgi:hypothetical protein